MSLVLNKLSLVGADPATVKPTDRKIAYGVVAGCSAIAAYFGWKHYGGAGLLAIPVGAIAGTLMMGPYLTAPVKA